MNRPILRQKLALPPQWRGAILRERLTAVLDEAVADGQHVGLFAGTGYGKTTLLATWARRREAVWITLDAEDADLDAFLHYLVHAFEQALPGFSTEARGLLARAREREGANAALSALLADLDEQCDRPLVLLLDDYHLAASPSLDALIARLLRYLPDNVRLVLAARKPPAIELASLQAARRLRVVDEPALAFDLAEIRALHPDQPDAGAGELLTATGGWPAAMGMTPELLDAYLEEQLLAGASAELRSFLQRLALVDAFDATLCEEALDAPLARERREALLQDRLIFPRGRDRYVLHPALRNLLLRRFMADVARDERRALLRRVGDYYWRTGQSATGLRFWIDAGEATWAADRLVAVADDWLAEGRLEALASALGALGPEAERPELLALQGELHRRWGDFARAEQLFERAVEGYGPAGPGLGRARARLGQAQVAASCGNVALARTRLAEARPEVVAVPRYELDVLNLEGGLALLSGETEEARARFEAACELARRLGDPYAEARALHNLGIGHIRLGEFRRALDCYDAGLAAGPGDGTPLVWMTPINRALVLLHLGQTAEAEAAAETSLAMVRRYNLTREEGYALRILGYAQLRRGAFEPAAICFESAERLARGANDALGVAYSLNFRAELALAEGDLGAATRLIDEVGTVMGGEQAATGILEFAQTRAKVLVASRCFDEAAALVAGLLERAERAGYRHIFEETKVLAGQIEQGGALERVVPPAEVPAALGAAGEQPPELSIRCFGGLQVTRRDAEVTDREWQTARSKLLLAFFVFHGEGATKARLLDTVFPDEDISNDLMNMTLMRLRKALEPGLQKGHPSRFVLRADGRYAFNQQAHIELDTREFENALKAARLAAGADEEALLERALALYRGDFLPEFDTPWVVGLRHRYQAQALDACRRLVALRDEGDATAAMATIQRALEIDPLSEEFNRELILRYLEAEEPHRALQHFQLCERRYREILNSPPPSDLATLVARAGA